MTHPSLNRLQRKGFALVVTLSLMVLLSIIAVGLLSLSAVTLRSGSQDQARMEARANARLALMIAIGELQKQLGPDQRVSANGAILSKNSVSHPHWTGVWDSWIAGPASDAPVNPAYPSGESNHQTIGSRNFGGGQFFFMNASKVDIAGMLGGTKFALKPGAHTIIEPKEMNKREGAEPNLFFTEFFFRKETEARPFFSSSWPANKKARSMVFFYHDTHNERLRMHTIRDYIPE